MTTYGSQAFFAALLMASFAGLVLLCQATIRPHRSTTPKNGREKPTPTRPSRVTIEIPNGTPTPQEIPQLLEKQKLLEKELAFLELEIDILSRLGTNMKKEEQARYKDVQKRFNYVVDTLAIIKDRIIIANYVDSLKGSAQLRKEEVR